MLCAQHLTSARALFACLVAAVAWTVAPPPVAADASARLSRAERNVIKRFNAVRAAAGLRPLRANRALSRSADHHSRDMVSANFFAHSSSNGTSMTARVSSFRRSRWLGEILAYLPGHEPRGQPYRVVRAWMRSPGHRAAILTPRFRRVGVARRRGAFGDSPVTVFTADFGSVR